MIINTQSTKKLYTVPNQPNACSVMQGMALAENALYCVKINSASTKAYLLNYPNYKSSKYTSVKYAELGHANDCTFFNGCLYIVTLIDNIITRINITTKERIDFKLAAKVALAVTGIANNGLDIIAKTAGAADSSYTTYSTLVFNEKTKTYSFKNSFKVVNPMVKDGYITRQGIFCKGNLIFIPYTRKNGNKLNENVIEIAEMDGSTQITPFEIWKISDTSQALFEIESGDFTSAGQIILNTNETSGDSIREINDVVIKN